MAADDSQNPSKGGKEFRIVNDAHRLMVDELRKIRPQKNTNQGVMICCPFHSDNTPSLSVNLTHGKVGVGVWFCFGGCGGGVWNKLAEKLGLRQIDTKTANVITEFYGRKANKKLVSEESVREQMVDEWGLDFVEPWPADRQWRGFPGAFLRAAGGEMAVDIRRKSEILLLPVKIDGEEVGFVKALMKKEEGALSYVNSPGEWSKNNGLFGYDLAASTIRETEANTVFVVEGARDALRPLYYGVPAVASLGAGIWSTAKRDLILALGVENVVVWGDSDEAGVKMTNVVTRSFKGFVNVKFINGTKLLAQAREHGLKGKKVDPGNCPLPLFKEIMRRHVPDAAAKRWELAFKEPA
jgi:DNA primase